jgi:hypothetical protein
VHRGAFIVVGLGAFFVVALAAILVLIYVVGGGKERGVSLKNLSSREVVVRFDDGQSARLAPDAEHTLSAKRENYPQTISVSDASGKTIFQRRLEFRDLSDMNFRLLIGDDGLVPLPTVQPERGIERSRAAQAAA